jgi:hypothetical protein
MFEFTFAACRNRGLERSKHVACKASSILEWQEYRLATLVSGEPEHRSCRQENDDWWLSL